MCEVTRVRSLRRQDRRGMRVSPLRPFRCPARFQPAACRTHLLPSLSPRSHGPRSSHAIGRASRLAGGVPGGCRGPQMSPPSTFALEIKCPAVARVGEKRGEHEDHLSIFGHARRRSRRSGKEKSNSPSSHDRPRTPSRSADGEAAARLSRAGLASDTRAPGGGTPCTPAWTRRT